MNRPDDHRHGAPTDPLFDPDDRELSRWLEAQRPTPSVGLQQRGRTVVRRAIHERVLRRRAARLLTSGWLALALALLISLT